MTPRRLIITGAVTLSILIGSTVSSYAQNISYKVQSGDTFYLIGQRYGISAQSLMNANNATTATILYPGNILTVPINNQVIHTVIAGDTYWTISQKYAVSFTRLLQANNADSNSWLNIGDKVIIPADVQASQAATYTIQAGDTFYLISQKYKVDLAQLMKLNNATESTILYIGQKIQIPQPASTASASTSTQPVTTYSDYTVKAGDTLWSIADKFGIPMTELLSANNMTESTWLNIGDVIKIPVHNVPVKATPGEQYGEYLDWWSEAQYVVPTQSILEVVDFETGKSFFAKRTTGTNHADVETLTLKDTQIMKEIWGGALSWARRPVIIKINGRKIAASASSLPHAGNDSAAGGSYTTWRSGNYPAGYNLDWVKDNGIDGVFDIHFANSTRHSDGLVDPEHQANVKIAAGLK